MKKRFLILTMLLVSIFSFQTVSAEESYNILADMSNQTYEILDMSSGGNPTNYVSLVDNYLLLENSTAMSLALSESDFEENSQYTLLLNVVSVSSSYNYFRVYTSYSLFNGEYIFHDDDVDVTGVYKILLTSRDDFTDEYASSFLVLHSNGSDVVFRATLLAGDYTSISDTTALNIIDNAVYGTSYTIPNASLSFITGFIAILSAWVTGFWGVVSSSINGAVIVFYDGTNLTTLGVLALFGLASGLVMFGLAFVKNLIKK